MEKWSPADVSKPFLMKVSDEYLQAPKKILFVGRETYGWGTYDDQDTAETLMASYENVSNGGEHYNSPFWWFREKFSLEMNIDKKDFMKATLWTNLSKIDVNKTTPTGSHFGILSQLFMSLLVAEIEIVKPDIVLILTTSGHYNWHLNYYRWAENEPFKDFKDASQLTRVPILSKKIDRLIANDRLPEHTYQICHPNVLRRKAGGYTKNADELINALTDQIKSQ